MSHTLVDNIIPVKHSRAFAFIFQNTFKDPSSKVTKRI